MNNEQTYPTSIFELQDRFQSDADCEAFFFDLRWPEGFRCPRCNASDYSKVKGRRTYSCRACYHQTSVTAGTVLHRSKISLRRWLWAIFFVARHKKSMSATELQKDLGLGSYNSAWLLLHKIRDSFGEKAEFLLDGLVELDETLIGAKGKGAKPGRDLDKKSLVITAIELGKRGKRGHKWAEVRAMHLPDGNADTIGKFVTENVKPKSTLLTDGLRAYKRLEGQGYEVCQDVSSKMTAKEMTTLNPLRHVHLFFSNLKTWLRGRFHGVSRKYLSAYLNEFLYRLNRRQDTDKNFVWVSRRLMNRSPMTLVRLRGH